jgi:hypothetical protein
MYEKTGYRFEMMICGGSKKSAMKAASDCFSINADDPKPVWTVRPNMPNARVMPDAVILPDGTILMTNGVMYGQAGGNAGQAQYAGGIVYNTDLFDSVSNTWSTVGKSSVPRLYHSGALLLPDATVITMGSEMQNYVDVYGDDFTIVPPSTVLKPKCWPYGNQACTNPYEYRIGMFFPYFK